MSATSVEGGVARPSARPAHVHGWGPKRGRWCPAPTARSVTSNPALGALDEVDPAESQWAFRWRNRVTGRRNYVLLADGDDSAHVFDAASRFAEDLASVRETILEDALDARSEFYREAVFALHVDFAHMSPAAPPEVIGSGWWVGDADLVKAAKNCPCRRQPGEAEVNGYLGSIQRGLTSVAIHYFHATRFALQVVKNARVHLRRARLSPSDVARLVGGFRVEASDDPLLRHARALGCPEVRFPTKRSGVIHYNGGVVGLAAARMWNTVPVPTYVGPACLYVDLLRDAGALEVAVEQVLAAPAETLDLAVCELNRDRELELRRGVLPEELEANDWFWEQKRRPTPEEDALVEGLVRRAAVPLAESVAPEGATLRAASRKNKVVALPAASDRVSAKAGAS